MHALGPVRGRHGRRPGRGRDSGPRLGLATRLALAEPVTAVSAFPAGLDAQVDGVGLPVAASSRPVLRARVVVDPHEATTWTVFVARLKSKRPILDPQAGEHDPREEALGKARALLRRTAEAAALRFLCSTRSPAPTGPRSCSAT